MIVWRTVLAAGLMGLLAGGRPAGRVELSRFDTRHNLLDWWPDQRADSLWFGVDIAVVSPPFISALPAVD